MKVNDTKRAEGEPSMPSSTDDTTTPSSSSTCSVSSPLIPRILSGSIGSIVTALAATPLEVVKIRQQIGAIAPTSFRGVKVEPCRGCGTMVLNNGLMECVLPIDSLRTIRPSSCSSSGTTCVKNGGTISTLLSIFRNEGYSGLYAGLRPTLVMSVPNTVLYFTAYDEISMRLRRNHVIHFTANIEDGHTNNTTTTTTTTEQLEEDARHQAYIPLLAGSTARLLASLATAPLELIRTRQASVVSPAAVPGMMEELRLLVRMGGFSSLYVGLAPTLWRDVPFSAIYWLFVERFRNSLSDSNDLGVWSGRYYRDQGMKTPPGIEAMHAFVSGAAAGSIAAAFTTPFDVVKTRRQMVGQAETSLAIDSCDHFGLKEYSNNGQMSKGGGRVNINIETFSYMQQILRQEGVAGLWKGNLTRMVKVAPACAIMISCYEFGKRVFGEVI